MFYAAVKSYNKNRFVDKKNFVCRYKYVLVEF